MKKVLLPLVLMFILLAGCQSEGLSISKLDKVSKKLDEAIISDVQFQLISDGKKGVYIVYHTSKEVNADVQAEDNIAKVIFDENSEGTVPNVFRLTMGKEQDTIMLIVDGEEMSFDVSSGM